MNEAYVRENRSIYTISKTRILLLIPIIIYGFYKNGILLYRKGYVGMLGMFKPLVYLAIGVLIGAFVNIFYEYLIKRNKDKFKSILFSSFHIEYGIVLSCLVSNNTDILIYSAVTFVIFLLSKFLNNRINTVALAFIVIYSISILYSDFSFFNAYELDKNLSLTFFDYITGRGVGGLFSTNLLLLFLALIFLHITNNNKTNISIASITTYFILVVAGSFILGYGIKSVLFYPTIIFSITFVATDSVTSPYTNNGMIVYGVLVGIITYGLTFFNPTIAASVSIISLSLFNSVIDRIVTKKIN